MLVEEEEGEEDEEEGGGDKMQGGVLAGEHEGSDAPPSRIH